MTPGVPPEADEPSAAARSAAAEPAGADMAGAGESERVALLAHDIRGALAVVVGYADLLEHRDLTANDRERALRGIHGAVRRADALLDALSGRSRTSARRESVDLAELVRDAAEDARAATGRQVRVIAEDSIEHLTTWLFHVAHNLTMDVLRQRVRQQEADRVSADPATAAEELAAQELDAVGEVIRQEARQVVLRELTQLDDEYRQVVLLKVVQGMTFRQVAEVVGVSLTTVNSRLNQGLSILAQRLRRAGVV